MCSPSSSSTVATVFPFASFTDHSIAAQRLHTEFKRLCQFPVQCCNVSPNSENIFQWIAVIEGPKETVYAGGTFFVELNFSRNYPFIAPEVVFLTRIYHCNISNQGKVRLQVTSRKGWRSSFDVAVVLQSIISLLHNCDPQNAFELAIGEQYQKQREDFNRTARIWTERFAH